MPSSIGLIYRNDRAQARIGEAITALADAGLDLPAAPAKTRDADHNDTLRQEWTADVLEAVSASLGARARKGGDPRISEASPDATVDTDTARKSTRAKGR